MDEWMSAYRHGRYEGRTAGYGGVVVVPRFLCTRGRPWWEGGGGLSMVAWRNGLRRGRALRAAEDRERTQEPATEAAAGG